MRARMRDNVYSPLDVWCASGCLSILTVTRFRTIYRGWMRAAWNINRKKKKNHRVFSLKLASLVTPSPFVLASSPHRSRYRMRTEKPQRERAKMPANEKKNDHDHRPSTLRPKIYEFIRRDVTRPRQILFVSLARDTTRICAFIFVYAAI